MDLGVKPPVYMGWLKTQGLGEIRDLGSSGTKRTQIRGLGVLIRSYLGLFRLGAHQTGVHNHPEGPDLDLFWSGSRPEMRQM